MDAVVAMPRDRRLERVVDQLMGCSTSIGANVAEADEAMSNRDFCKSLAITLKELNETRFWCGLVGRKDWPKPLRLTPLMEESDLLKRIIGAIIRNTRSRERAAS